MNNIKQLSEYPSEAILQAVEDLEWAEKNPKYYVDMAIWHYPRQGHCRVGLTGSILARRYVKDHNISSSPLEIKSSLLEVYTEKGAKVIIAKLFSFSSLRRGDIYSFLEAWIKGKQRDKSRMTTTILNEVEGGIVNYHDNPNLFKQQLRKIAKILNREGY